MAYKLISEKELNAQFEARLNQEGGIEYHIEYRVSIPAKTDFSKLDNILWKSRSTI